MANLVLNTKTYGGRGVVNAVAEWVNAGVGLLSAFARATASVKLPSGKEAKANVQWRLRLPVVADEASPCACPGEAVDEIYCYIQIRATKGVTTAVRTDFALQVKDLVATPEFQASIISYTQPTG